MNSTWLSRHFEWLANHHFLHQAFQRSQRQPSETRTTGHKKTNDALCSQKVITALQCGVGLMAKQNAICRQPADRRAVQTKLQFYPFRRSDLWANPSSRSNGQKADKAGIVKVKSNETKFSKTVKAWLKIRSAEHAFFKRGYFENTLTVECRI